MGNKVEDIYEKPHILLFQLYYQYKKIWSK